MIAYKLLNRDLTTRGRCQWKVGVKKTTNGKGELCGPGWLHGYEYKEIAYFLNPIHANFENPVLYKVKVGGICKKDNFLKSGWTEMTLLEPVADIENPSTIQCVRFALYCSLFVYSNTPYRNWAIDWLQNKNRSQAASRAAEATSQAAEATSQAAEATSQAVEATSLAAQAAIRAAQAASRTAEAASWAAEATAEKNVNFILDAAHFAMSNQPIPSFLGKNSP